MTDALVDEERELLEALVAMDEAVRSRARDEATRSRAQVGHAALGRAIALGRDVLTSSSTLRTLHGEATDVYSKDPESQGLIVRFGTRLEAPDAADRLGTAYKVLLLFVRAYQDAIYAVLYEQQMGRRAGHSTMRNAVEKAGNPVGALLRDRLPEYLDWFASMRELRNEIKEGANFGLVGPLQDLGVSVTRLSDSGAIGVEFRQGRILKLHDATVAVGASKFVTELATGSSAVERS